MTTMEILRKIFRNPEEELLMFDNLEVLNIYEKDNDKYYLKSFSRGEEEKEVYNPKNGGCHPEEIVRQLYLHRLLKYYRYPKELIEIEKASTLDANRNARTLLFIVLTTSHRKSSLKLKLQMKRTTSNNSKVI